MLVSLLKNQILDLNVAFFSLCSKRRKALFLALLDRYLYYEDQFKRSTNANAFGLNYI
uniref:Uncharacterized protein n=1 Tax=Myoviridae sp. ctoNH1 TaxID=2826695 RepID=A0A8S5QSB3_9CAUD|nr:MAG TPA: hypothetical protein [Myoviridae sp. ctoNH1]